MLFDTKMSLGSNKIVISWLVSIDDKSLKLSGFTYGKILPKNLNSFQSSTGI